MVIEMNSIIMADDLAFELGEFFADLKNATDWELTNFGINNNIVCHTSFLDGSYNASSLAEPIAKINNCPFLCFIYAHGQEDSVFIGANKVFSVSDNYYLLSNAVIYTFSCNCGGILADKLLENKAILFVGYKGTANCPYGLDGITVSVVLSFIQAFLSGKTAKDSFESLYDAYSAVLRDSTLDPFQRAAFQESRDALVLKGDENVRVCDLLVV